MLTGGLRVLAAAAVAATVAIPAAAVDRGVTIHNNTGYEIYRFYSTNSGSSKWGSDVMGRSTLPSGSSMRLNFDNEFDYCEFDFRIELQDGTAYEERRVNVCEVGDFTFN